MPYDSVRVHAALFFVKSVLSPTGIIIQVLIVVCFSPVREARTQTESISLQNYYIYMW